VRAAAAGTGKLDGLCLPWVCEQCGEPLFEDATVDAIQDILRKIERGVKWISVPLPIVS
jgi:hypothetical protein